MAIDLSAPRALVARYLEIEVAAHVGDIGVASFVIIDAIGGGATWGRQ